MLVYQRVLFIGQIQLLMDNAWRIVISYGDFIPNTMGYVYNHQNMISYMVDIVFPLWLVKILHVN